MLAAGPVGGAAAATAHPAATAHRAATGHRRRGARAAAGPPPPVTLDSGWRFTADPSNSGIWQDWPQGGSAGADWAAVSLPNDFNPTVESSGDRGQVGWYEVSFTGPAMSRGQSWRIAFESVRRNAQVWLNGVKVGSNSDPYAPFSVPAMTLMPGRPNLLVVRVDNYKGPARCPRTGGTGAGSWAR